MPVEMTIKMRPSGYVAQVVRPMARSHFTPRVQAAHQAVVAAAPSRETGRMKRSIRMYARDGAGRFASHSGAGETICSYEIAIEVPYAGFVIRGTRRYYPIHSHGPWPLRNRYTDQIFGPAVIHPGQAANDFVTRAMKASGF